MQFCNLCAKWCDRNFDSKRNENAFHPPNPSVLSVAWRQKERLFGRPCINRNGRVVRHKSTIRAKTTVILICTLNPWLSLWQESEGVGDIAYISWEKNWVCMNKESSWWSIDVDCFLDGLDNSFLSLLFCVYNEKITKYSSVKTVKTVTRLISTSLELFSLALDWWREELCMLAGAVRFNP